MHPAKLRQVKTLVTRGLIAALIIAGLVVLGRRLGGSVAPFAQAVDHLGPAGPLAFIAGYAIACIVLVPASLLTLAAGAIFGVLWGTLYTLAGAIIGATIAFLIARYAARGLVERRLSNNPRFAAIDRAVGAEGLKIVTLLRLSPVVPFSLLNYGLGLTHVRLSDYLIAMIGIVPGTLLYVYYGKVGGDLAALASGTHPSGGTAGTALLVLGLVATIAVTVLIGRIARRALDHVI